MQSSSDIVKKQRISRVMLKSRRSWTNYERETSFPHLHETNFVRLKICESPKEQGEFPKESRIERTVSKRNLPTKRTKTYADSP
jgi:hypothetical protein